MTFDAIAGDVNHSTVSTREIYAFPTTLSILRQYEQKALCIKTPLSRGETGRLLPTRKIQKKNNNLPIFRLVCHRQPSNDICNSCNQMKFYLFADDTNLLYADKNLKSLESTINDELCKLYDWLIENKLSLNIKKSNYVIFRKDKKRSNMKLT